MIDYLCDSCGFRGRVAARSADDVLCEVCGQPVLADPDAGRDDEPGRSAPS